MSTETTTERVELEPTVLDTEPVYKPAELTNGEVVTSPEPQVAPRPLPVAGAERHFSVDVMRGVALLGILAMNIVAFGWPGVAYGNPMSGGGFEGFDRFIWYFNHLFFEMKMMTTFSMLFGAGLVLMDQRAEARGAHIRGVYYRRVLWLLAIGMVHAYLIWSGDILVLYAECGLFLYFFRNLAPRTLIILGIAALFYLVPILTGITAGIDSTKDYFSHADARVLAREQAGQLPELRDRAAQLVWHGWMSERFREAPEKELKSWNEQIEIHRGGYWGIVKERSGNLLGEHTIGFLLAGWSVAMGRMLIGMGLMKTGVFSATRSRRFYLWMMALGYGIGLPLMIFDANELIAHNFSGTYEMHGGLYYNLFGSMVVALGHVGMVMLIVQSGALSWLTKRLAAVGRMALSNYLTHSIVCTTLFYGYGFGLFGTINRTGLAAIVLVIWVSQLLISPIWLRHFRYGPAEWLWRSLTYWKLQPMRV
jgi:uncharacterized protein